MERGWRVAHYDEMKPAWAGVDWETLSARMREQDRRRSRAGKRLRRTFPTAIAPRIPFAGTSGSLASSR
jgi:hypothetical protein